MNRAPYAAEQIQSARSILADLPRDLAAAVFRSCVVVGYAALAAAHDLLRGDSFSPTLETHSTIVAVPDPSLD